MIELKGTAAAPGIAIGIAYVIQGGQVELVKKVKLKKTDVTAEIERFKVAIAASKEQLLQASAALSEVTDQEHASILEAQAMFLDDVALTEQTIAEIKKKQYNAEYVFDYITRQIVEKFKVIENPLFQSRDRDVLDIASRVLANLRNEPLNTLSVAPENAIIVAHDIPPSETPVLFSKHIEAFVLDKGGPTSHTAIIAKAVEIPAVVAVATASSVIKTGDRVIIDGCTGKVIVDPDKKVLDTYKHLKKLYENWVKENESLVSYEAETKDGYTIALRANIELPDEIRHISKHGCKGIGLFRTEFLFMNRLTLPSEKEQFEIYKKAIQDVAPQPIVFRTIDIGGDKFFSHVVFSKEINPYLGQRAVRLCLKQTTLFHDQLRAILRASAFGKAKLLIPMISGLDEFMMVKKHIQQVKSELDEQNIPYDKTIPLGAMIEVPSAALVAAELAKECDFFSIGTNDLIQYTLAVDRSNEAVAYLYEPANPAVLMLLNHIMEAAQQEGIPVSVCGELASDPLYAMLLIGMGVSELSMSASSVPAVKKLIRMITLREAKNLVYQVLNQRYVDDVKSAVQSVLRPYIKTIKEAQKTPTGKAWFKSSLL